MPQHPIITSVAAFAVFSIAVTGCATSIAGTAAADSPPASSSMASSMASGAPDSVASAATSATVEPVGSAAAAVVPPVDPAKDATAPAAPDPDGVAYWQDEEWIITFCSGFAEINDYAVPDTTGMTITELQLAAFTAYDDMAQLSSTFSLALNGLPEPVFNGHESLVPAVHHWFDAIGINYGRSAEVLATVTFATEAQMTDLISPFEDALIPSNEELTNALDSRSEHVDGLMRALPQCDLLTGASG